MSAFSCALLIKYGTTSRTAPYGTYLNACKGRSVQWGAPVIAPIVAQPGRPAATPGTAPRSAQRGAGQHSMQMGGRAHLVPVLPQHKRQVVCHAEQLPKGHAASGRDAQLRHEPDRALGRCLVVRGQHELSVARRHVVHQLGHAPAGGRVRARRVVGHARAVKASDTLAVGGTPAAQPPCPDGVAQAACAAVAAAVAAAAAAAAEEVRHGMAGHGGAGGEATAQAARPPAARHLQQPSPSPAVWCVP